jgi:hypothetical protein
MGTKTFARFLAKNLHRHLQNNLLVNDRIKINDVIMVITEIKLFGAKFCLFVQQIFVRWYEGVSEIVFYDQRSRFQTSTTG